MNNEIQLVIMAVLALYEIYTIHYHDASAFAIFWDYVARVAGAIANLFANVAMQARLAYFEAVRI